MTAFNPFSEPTDPRANRLRQQMLRRRLHDERYQVIDAEGMDPHRAWPPEPSLLVLGTGRRFEDSLLRDYEQHAVVVAMSGQPVELALHPAHRV